MPKIQEGITIPNYTLPELDRQVGKTQSSTHNGNYLCDLQAITEH